MEEKKKSRHVYLILFELSTYKYTRLFIDFFSRAVSYVVVRLVCTLVLIVITSFRLTENKNKKKIYINRFQKKKFFLRQFIFTTLKKCLKKWKYIQAYTCSITLLQILTSTRNVFSLFSAGNKSKGILLDTLPYDLIDFFLLIFIIFIVILLKERQPQNLDG